MSILLFAISVIAFYSRSKYFPKDLYPKLSESLGSKPLSLALGWGGLLIGSLLEVFAYGVFSGVLVSFFVYTLLLSCVVLFAPMQKRSLLVIMGLSLFCALIYQFV